MSTPIESAFAAAVVNGPGALDTAAAGCDIVARDKRGRGKGWVVVFVVKTRVVNGTFATQTRVLSEFLNKNAGKRGYADVSPLTRPGTRSRESGSNISAQLFRHVACWWRRRRRSRPSTSSLRPQGGCLTFAKFYYIIHKGQNTHINHMLSELELLSQVVNEFLQPLHLILRQRRVVLDGEGLGQGGQCGSSIS